MEEIEGVEEFIDESIEELKGVRGDGVLDEDALREPVSTLEPRKPVVVGPQTPALEAVAVMREQGMGCVLVVRSNRLKGIFTERDVLNNLVGMGTEVAKTPVRKLMTGNPETLRPSDSIAYALNKMSLGGYRHIPLVDNSDAPVGVISVKDIVNYLVKLFPKSVMNLPTLPRGNYAREREGA
ncbi:MAG TPA: CBS domain-containing protein [Deltaproteobacteria bacterium]|nr:CBS domain-containing protein [Candidatus Binatota bacterium]HIL13942.1 CBS domain-containing protein [Deltaproteobacteria bacterium]